jgi:hypothetical protein
VHVNRRREDDRAVSAAVDDPTLHQETVVTGESSDVIYAVDALEDQGVTDYRTTGPTI